MFERRPSEVFLSYLHQIFRMFCERVFEAAKDLQISNFVASKIKTKEKNNLLLDSMRRMGQTWPTRLCKTQFSEF